jgi:flagellar hook-associated protein 1 FlgK
MSLDAALSIAGGGLANINAQFALISQNVANAATPSYAVEVPSQTALTADGIGLGVRTGTPTLQINLAVQAALQQQNATVTGLQTTQTSLQSIDSVLGTPGSGDDIGSLLGNLKDSFSTLLTNPSSQAQQSAVVSAATTLAQGINGLSNTYTAQREAAQGGLNTGVTTLNTTLATIGQLSSQIIALQPTGISTADLQNQRNAAVATLSTLMSVKTAEQPNGDLTIFTSSGLTLPTQGGSATAPFAVTDGSARPGSDAAASVTLNGADITGQIQGGQLGADITLQNTTLPTYQAELDEFSYGLATGFSNQGLSLFNTPAVTPGQTPVQTGYVGYAAGIQVNAAVTANPSLVRDGTNTITGTVNGNTATIFTPNDPTTGQAGFTSLINNVLNYTFGTSTQNGVPATVLNTTGLGDSGNLNAPFSSVSSLSQYATNLVSSQALASSSTTGSLTTEQALQTSLTAKMSSVSGVNMDTEMSQMIGLQNAYGANARIITAVQTMFGDLEQMLR